MTKSTIVKSIRKSKFKMIGCEFERWTVLERAESKKHRMFYKCRCKCGTIKNVSGTSLRNNSSKSCGCLNKEVITKHGMCGTPTYASWQDMLTRCTNKNFKWFKNYGGRGITVCDRWSKFENFLEDMGERPKELTIERIDNDGNYEPSNCEWATRLTQSQNQRLYKNNTTGISGVYWDKRYKKYKVYIGAKGKLYHLGQFSTFEIAKMARKKAEQKYWRK